jgi:hypothetical protein
MRPRRHHQGRVCPHHTHKTALKPWQHTQGVIPPQATADVGCARENVLEVYTRPSAPTRPQVCVDDTSQLLVADTRVPIPAAPGRPARVEDAYERQGTAPLLMVFEPLARPRRGNVTARRTAVDFAPLRRELVDSQEPQADKLVLVMDTLNPPKPASRADALDPAEARRLLERLERHDTPQLRGG